MFKSIYRLFHHHYHTRYHGVYAHAKQLFVFDLALLGLALILLGTSIFFFVWKPGITDQIELKISLGNDRIRSGDTIRVTIDYTNHSKFILKGGVLALRMPPGFSLSTSTSPSQAVFSSQNTIDIPTIKPGASEQIHFTGKLWAEPLREEKIIATLSYTPESTNRPEQKLATYLISLPRSVLESSFAIATTTFLNAPLPFTYTLTNTSDDVLNNIELSFAPEKTTVETKERTAFSLSAHETKTITGKISPPSDQSSLLAVITARILTNNHWFEQSREERTVAILTPRLRVKSRFLNPPAYVEPGQKIPLEIQWANDSAFRLHSMRLRLTFTPGTVDVKTTARENNLKTDGTNLIVDAVARTALANGTAGSSDLFTINLSLLPSFNLGGTENTSFSVTPMLEAASDLLPNQTFSQTGETIHLPIATELTLKGEARYYTAEGDQLGRGPLPPIVGETTKYWIFVQTFNTVNPVSGAVFQTTLAPGVVFTGKQSVTIGPQLNFDEGTRIVSWRFSELPANSQTGLYFEVAVTPNPEQIGKTIPLTGSLSFSATDEVTGKQFNLSRSGLTNTLSSTDEGSRKGAAVTAQ